MTIIYGTRVDDSAESIDGLGVTSPLVVDLLTDGGELDWLAVWSALEDLVFADGHGDDLGLEDGGDL